MKLVLPGEIVGVEEEAIPVNGIYVDKRGYLRASIIGTLQLDRFKKTINIRPVNKRILQAVRQGSIVEGIVINQTDEIALVRIYRVDENRVVAIGILHISQLASEYVQDIYSYIKPSDIIKARVLNNIPPYVLSIKEPSTGVIAAQCSNCGSRLYTTLQGTLVCKNCGNQEKRKTVVGGYIYTLPR